MRRSKRKKQQYTSDVPLETLKELYRILADQKLNKVKFADLCEEKPELFGLRNSELRFAVQQKRNNLLKHRKKHGTLPPFDDQKETKQPLPTHPSTPPPTTTTSSPSAAIFASPSPSIRSPSYHRTMADSARPKPPPIADPGSTNQLSWNICECSDAMFLDGGSTQAIDTKGNRASVQLVRLALPIYSTKDFNKGLMLACLSEPAGDGLWVRTPRVPHFMIEGDETSVAAFSMAMDAQAGLAPNQSLADAMWAQVLYLTETPNPDFKFKWTFYKFPPNVSCNNFYFNGKELEDDFEVVLHFAAKGSKFAHRTKQGQRVKVKTSHPMMYAILAVDDDGTRARKLDGRKKAPIKDTNYDVWMDFANLRVTASEEDSDDDDDSSKEDSPPLKRPPKTPTFKKAASKKAAKKPPPKKPDASGDEDVADEEKSKPMEEDDEFDTY